MRSLPPSESPQTPPASRTRAGQPNAACLSSEGSPGLPWAEPPDWAGAPSPFRIETAPRPDCPETGLPRDRTAPRPDCPETGLPRDRTAPRPECPETGLIETGHAKTG